MEHNLSQLSIIVSCRRRSENTNSRIQAVKILILKFLSQIILTFFKQTLEFFDFGICLCWFCCLRHQKSHAYCVIFALLLAHTDSLWHQCRNVSTFEWILFFLFSLLSSKKQGFFSLLQLVHSIKSKRRNTFRIIENSWWQFQHSSLFSRVLEDRFTCYVQVYHIYLCIMCTRK